MKYLTRDNITLALSIIGSAGTVITWIVSYVKSRKNLSVKIVKLLRSKNIMILYIMINNKSRLPIAIESLSITYKDKIFPCALIPKKTFERTTKTGSVIKENKSYYTLQLPIYLPSLGGTSGYFLFDIPEEVSQNLSTPLTVLIHSNRGKATEMKLPFESVESWEEMF